MQRETYPLVLAPRYTTYAGSDSFTTVGIDVSRFDQVLLTVWRGVLIGSGPPSIQFLLEVSQDQDTWRTLAGPLDPGANSDALIDELVSEKYLRLNVVTTGADTVVTLWAVGYLVSRRT